MSRRILVLPGDGIGPEIVAEALKVLDALDDGAGSAFDIERSAIGGEAIDAHGVPLPGKTLDRARACDAILLGAVGGPKWDELARDVRPERGLLSPAFGARCIRELPSGDRVPAARGRVDPEARRGSRARRADRSGADRRDLLRAGREGSVCARTVGARGSTHSCTPRTRSSGCGRVAFDAARRRAGPSVLGRQGQRARDERGVARSRDEGRARVRRRRAEPHVRGQCGDAARSRSEAVRRHRDEQTCSATSCRISPPC